MNYHNPFNDPAFIDKYTQQLNGHVFTDQEMTIQDGIARMCPNQWAGEANEIIITSAHKLNTSIYEQVEVIA